MLNIYYGDMPEAIYNTSIYFANTYKDEWITTELSKAMIKDVDKSEVISSSLIKRNMGELVMEAVDYV